MSSFKRIPKSLVKQSEKVISINERYSGGAENYLGAVESDELKKILLNTKDKEKEMMDALTAKEELFIQQAYEKGFERAKQEVEKDMREEYQSIVNEAQKMYIEANEHHKKMIADSEALKEQYIKEKKDEILELMVRFSENLIHQEIDRNPEKMEKVFNEALESVRYETKKIFVRLNPRSKEWFLRNNPIALNTQIELLSDATLQGADLIIETDREFIDVTIRSQLEQLKQSLRGA